VRNLLWAPGTVEILTFSLWLTTKENTEAREKLAAEGKTGKGTRFTRAAKRQKRLALQRLRSASSAALARIESSARTRPENE